MANNAIDAGLILPMATNASSHSVVNGFDSCGHAGDVAVASLARDVRPYMGGVPKLDVGGLGELINPHPWSLTTLLGVLVKDHHPGTLGGYLLMAQHALANRG